MFMRPKGSSLTDQHKLFILSKMKAAGSLQYVSNVLAQLHEQALGYLDEVEVELGPNAPLRAIITGVRCEGPSHVQNGLKM